MTPALFSKHYGLGFEFEMTYTSYCIKEILPFISKEQLD